MRVVPYRWSGREMRDLGARGGALVPVDRGGDRRVLACANPGFGGAPYPVSTLWAAVQYLGGHEVAPAHRHTPAALRFVVEGEGVFTIVDGDLVRMGTEDLILTPSWAFHEHHNPTPHPMTWIDVLDLSLVAALDAIFFEEGPTAEADTSTAECSALEISFGASAGLVPAGGPALPEHRSPMLAYRWVDTECALSSQLAASTTTHARIRYTDPVRGGDVLPTLRNTPCFRQWPPTRASTSARRAGSPRSTAPTSPTSCAGWSCAVGSPAPVTPRTPAATS